MALSPAACNHVVLLYIAVFTLTVLLAGTYLTLQLQVNSLYDVIVAGKDTSSGSSRSSDEESSHRTEATVDATERRPAGAHDVKPIALASRNKRQLDDTTTGQLQWTSDDGGSGETTSAATNAHAIWMNSYSRIPISALNEFCLTITENCPPAKQGEQGPAGQHGLPGQKGELGEKGTPGEAGVKGERGEQGEGGVKGEKGEAGVNGVDGIPGTKGEQGDQGVHGLAGTKGDCGDRGEKGEAGSPGADGRPGIHGQKGEQGDKGEKGVDNDSSQEQPLPGKPGPPGEKGEPGMPGQKGQKGDEGLPGHPGTPGLNGTDGRRGRRGPQGLKGDLGPLGPAGNVTQPDLATMTGMRGLPGPPGLPGVKGPKGEPGYSCGCEMTTEEMTTELMTTVEPTVLPRITDCLIDRIGKPVFQKSIPTYWGMWMKDARPSLLLGDRYWLTKHFTGKFLFSYETLEQVRKDEPASVYELRELYFGTGNVVYNGSFYYHRAGFNEIIRYDLATNESLAKVHIARAAFQSKDYVFSTEYNYFDLSADDNGLWTVYAAESEPDFLLVSKLDLHDLTIEKTWNISVRHQQYGNSFVVCGVLYLIKDVTSRKTFIDYAYDLYTKQTININLQFHNPYQMNNMIAYNHAEQTIYSCDKGHLLTYPLLLHA